MYKDFMISVIYIKKIKMILMFIIKYIKNICKILIIYYNKNIKINNNFKIK